MDVEKRKAKIYIVQVHLAFRDRPFFMREGGLVGLGGGGHSKKLAWKGGPAEKNEGKGGGGSDEKIRLKIG